MAENSVVHAPYNFVPFSDKVLSYQGEVPAHDSTDPALKTGEIHVTLEAVTPVFVSDGNKNDPHFIKGPNGRFMLPGSTIRGMARQNMQILGFGLVRPGEDLEDKRVFYREIAAARNSTSGELKDYYHSVLAVKPHVSPSGTSYSVPENVKAGYLRRLENGDGYYIQPVSGTYLKVSKETLSYAGLENHYAAVIAVDYVESEGGFVKKLQRAGGPVPAGMRRGMLLCPGVDTGGDGTRGANPKPPSHRYVFPLPDEAAEAVGISKEDALSYASDWESRKNSLKGGTQIGGRKIPYDPDFWKLPADGEEKPVFYIHHDGHIFFGMSLFPRIGYRFSLKEGLPQRHRELEDQLDYPRAILGYAQKEGSLRSRVSFGDFPAQGAPKELAPVKTILGNPKISYYPGYVVKGKHYNDEEFRLRGYKYYWMKEVQKAAADKENVASTLRPLPAGTKFSGVIRYRNLRAEELGLLLWALRLEEGCCQTVGMGKPYGYGRMKLVIDELREYDMRTLYSPDDLCGGAAAASVEKIQEYIDRYDSAACKALYIKKPSKKKPSVTSQDEIQDFFCMHRALLPPEKTGYMDLKEYQNIRYSLPDAASFREELDAAAKAAREAEKRKSALDENSSMAEMAAMLAKKFNRH